MLCRACSTTLSAPHPPTVYIHVNGSPWICSRRPSIFFSSPIHRRTGGCLFVWLCTLVLCAQRVECNVYYTRLVSSSPPARNDGLPGITQHLAGGKSSHMTDALAHSAGGKKKKEE
jgi:hypothetical protein